MLKLQAAVGRSRRLDTLCGPNCASKHLVFCRVVQAVSDIMVLNALLESALWVVSHTLRLCLRRGSWTPVAAVARSLPFTAAKLEVQFEAQLHDASTANNGSPVAFVFVNAAGVQCLPS